MTAFELIELPPDLAVMVQRATGFRTDIVESGAGFEWRNAAQARPRRRYQLQTGPRPLDEMRQLAAFFEARQGRLQGFVVRDWLLPQMTAQTLLQIDERHLAFQMPDAPRDNRANGENKTDVIVPVPETVTLSRDGDRLQAGRDYSLDAARGMVQLSQPLGAAQVTADFDIYVPVRFDSDRLEMTRLAHDMASMTPLPMVELRLSRRMS